MGVVVNAAVGVLAAFLGGALSAAPLGSQLAILVALVFGGLGFLIAAAVFKDAAPAPSVDSWAEKQAKKDAKKAKKQEADAKAAAAREAARAAEAAAKAAEEAAKKEAKKADKKAAKKPEPEPEQPKKGKKADKKAEEAAKKKAEEEAKAAAEAEAAKKKKNKKNKDKAAPAAAPAAAASAPAASAAAASAAAAAMAKALEKSLEEEGWVVQPIRQPSKKQQERAEAKKVEAEIKAAAQSSSSLLPAQHTNLKPVTVDVVVPLNKHPLIIGAGGETLKKLASGSGAKIEMPKKETGSAKIKLSGTPDQIALAKNAIESLSERGFSNITHPGVLSDEIAVEKEVIGSIVGPSGATLKTIQTKLEVRINLPEKDAKSSKITIVGIKENVKQAKSILRQLINDGFSPLTHEGYTKVEIAFPKEKLGLLIGPKGQTIKSIQGNTKTRINMPAKTATGPAANVVSVVGLPAGVSQAQKEILRLLEPPAPLPDPEEEDIATDEAWGQHHTAQGEDALW